MMCYAYVVIFLMYTGQPWSKGLCVNEFERVCANATAQGVDLASGLTGVRVQDTDLAFRPRVTYDIWRETAQVSNNATEAIATHSSRTSKKFVRAAGKEHCVCCSTLLMCAI